MSIYESYNMKEFEKFFRDKIDWKFINRIQDKLTKYEDIGLESLIRVYVLNSFGVFSSIYEIEDDKGRYGFYLSIEEAFECYNAFGLFYAAGLIDKDDSTNSTYTNEFVKSISSFITIYKDTFVFQPK